MLDPKCIYQKSIFAKCTRLACLLSFASLFNRSFWPKNCQKQCLPVTKSERAWIFSPLGPWPMSNALQCCSSAARSSEAGGDCETSRRFVLELAKGFLKQATNDMFKGLNGWKKKHFNLRSHALLILGCICIWAFLWRKGASQSFYARLRWSMGQTWRWNGLWRWRQPPSSKYQQSKSPASIIKTHNWDWYTFMLVG